MSVPETIIDTLKKRLGRSGSAPLGFSGQDMVPIMDRVKGTSSVFKAKGFVGVAQSAMKGERPVLSKMAPGLLKKPAETSEQRLPILKRLPAYNQNSGSSVPEMARKGGTQIGSIGN
jgi:hypothetical protein